MLYINNPDLKPLLYRDLVDMAIKSGIQPQRAYIYLAALGVKGALTRQLLSDQVSYGKPRKLAVNTDSDTFVMSASICETCKSLHVS